MIYPKIENGHCIVDWVRKYYDIYIYQISIPTKYALVNEGSCWDGGKEHSHVQFLEFQPCYIPYQVEVNLMDPETFPDFWEEGKKRCWKDRVYFHSDYDLDFLRIEPLKYAYEVWVAKKGIIFDRSLFSPLKVYR